MESEPQREKQWWENYPLHKIWCNDFCPLVPRIWQRKADEYNAWDGGFHWLFLKVWTMSHFSFGFDISFDFVRIGFGFILPWLRIWIGSDVPWQLTHILYRYTSRKGLGGY